MLKITCTVHNLPTVPDWMKGDHASTQAICGGVDCINFLPISILYSQLILKVPIPMDTCCARGPAGPAHSSRGVARADLDGLEAPITCAFCTSTTLQSITISSPYEKPGPMYFSRSPPCAKELGQKYASSFSVCRHPIRLSPAAMSSEIKLLSDPDRA